MAKQQPKATLFGFAPVLLTLLAACATPATTVLTDGSTALLIECESRAGGLNYCFERAGKSCGAKGFTVVDEAGRTIGSGNPDDGAANTSIASYVTIQNALLVKCNP